MAQPDAIVTPLDVLSIRKDFPILGQEHHPGVPLIYLDNAATSQKPGLVIQGLDDYYRRYNANVHRGIHKLSEEATSAYEGARLKVRQFINARSRREIVFTKGTTESINLVAQSWGRANLNANDVVISTVMEHHSNIVPWQILAGERGFSIEYLPLTGDGKLDLEYLERLLVSRSVKLVTIMHVSNVLGTINPVTEIVRMAHRSGALVLVDGAQSVPNMPVDVQALDADFLAFSGHKMVGPTGIGVLYAKRGLLEAMPPWIGGGDMISSVRLEGSTWNDLPYKFEAGTPAIAQAIGLGYAVDYLSGVGMERIQQYERTLVDYLLERLAEVPGVRVYGPSASERGTVASFTFGNIHPHDVAQMLDSEGVAVRAGHHCAMPLHDYLGLPATTRASLYLYNLTTEIDALVAALYKARRVLGG